MSCEIISELETVVAVGAVIGEGTFSTVYKGTLQSRYNSSKPLAIKCITPIVEPQMLENELRCLTILNGKQNVVPLLFASRHKDKLALVMPYFEHDRFNRLVRRFKCNHVREYMYQLFLSMEHIHSHDIIHRDVKPNNFLYSARTKQCALVDFGLAQTIEQCAGAKALSKNPVPEDIRVPLEDLTITNANTGRVSLCDKPKKRKNRNEDSTVARGKGNCSCRGHAKICRECLATPAVNAARAGTAGYRPPEVY